MRKPSNLYISSSYVKDIPWLRNWKSLPFIGISFCPGICACVCVTRMDLGTLTHVKPWALCCAMLSRSVVFTLCDPMDHWLQPARHLCPWGFSRHEYWGGLPCPSPGDLPHPGLPHCKQILYQLNYREAPMGSDQNLITGLLTLYCPFSYKMNMFGWFNVQIMIMVNSTVLYIQKLLRE